jgi:prepilin-type N-terminal cleavage/methylation domain-containing protein/prepilin-type processing-associated H-X9-DG protein
MRRAKVGFTLIELLVVVAIIAVLIGLLLPAVQKVREAAARMKCSNNLKQIALAAHGYHDVNERFPGGTVAGPRISSLFVELLPHVEQAPLYRQWDFTNSSTNYSGSPARAAVVISVYVCPSHPALPHTPNAALTTYGGNGGTKAYPAARSALDGMFHTTGTASEPNPNQTAVRLTDVSDGTSSTLLFGERAVGDPVLDSYLSAPAGVITPAPNPPIAPSASYAVWAPPPGPNACSGLLSGEVSIGYRYGFPWVPPPAPLPGFPPPAPEPVPWGGLSTAWWARMGAYGSYHPGGVNVALADGSVRFLRVETPVLTLRAMSTRNGGEVVVVE